jgi:hypothetical protein
MSQKLQTYKFINSVGAITQAEFEQAPPCNFIAWITTRCNETPKNADHADAIASGTNV